MTGAHKIPLKETFEFRRERIENQKQRSKKNRPSSSVTEKVTLRKEKSFVDTRGEGGCIPLEPELSTRVVFHQGVPWGGGGKGRGSKGQGNGGKGPS